MSEGNQTWPEQNAVDEWCEKHAAKGPLGSWYIYADFNILMELKKAVTAYRITVDKERDALKAKQTRWVKCSERMPTIANSEDEPYLCRITVKDDPATWRVLADWGDGRFKPFDTLLTGWTVIAWLENVPEYVP